MSTFEKSGMLMHFLLWFITCEQSVKRIDFPFIMKNSASESSMALKPWTVPQYERVYMFPIIQIHWANHP